MQSRFTKLVVAAGAAAVIATGALPRPAQADANTTRDILLAAAAAGAVVLYDNWQHKQQQANTVVGYTRNGGTVYADGRIVEPNGQTIYPQNGQYNLGQYGNNGQYDNGQYGYNNNGQYNGQYTSANGGYVNGKYYGPGQYNGGQYGYNNGQYGNNGQYNNGRYNGQYTNANGGYVNGKYYGAGQYNNSQYSSNRRRNADKHDVQEQNQNRRDDNRDHH